MLYLKVVKVSPNLQIIRADIKGQNGKGSVPSYWNGIPAWPLYWYQAQNDTLETQQKWNHPVFSS